jgi:hypothetical protein
MLKARGKKLEDDYTGSGRADFEQYLLAPVAPPWCGTSGALGGDYELLISLVAARAALQFLRRTQSTQREACSFLVS